MNRENKEQQLTKRKKQQVNANNRQHYHSHVLGSPPLVHVLQAKKRILDKQFLFFLFLFTYLYYT